MRLCNMRTSRHNYITVHLQSDPNANEGWNWVWPENESFLSAATHTETLPRGFAQFFPVFPSSWRRFIATCRQHSEEAPIGKCWNLNNGERDVFLLKRTNVECRTHWAPLITSNCRDCRLQSVLDKKWFSKLMQGSGQPAFLLETHFGASVFFPLHFFHSCQLWAKTHTHKKTNQKFKVRLKR